MSWRLVLPMNMVWCCSYAKGLARAEWMRGSSIVMTVPVAS